MRNHDLSHDCLRTAAAALLIAGGIGVGAAQKARAGGNPSAPSAASAQVPQSGPAFVNGALAAPGADKDAATVPAKFSARHDAEDHLPTLAFTFKNLSDAQRRAIVASVKDAKTAPPQGGAPPEAYAKPSMRLPSPADLRAPPGSVTAPLPEVEGYR